ncbi:MAG TPA: hypothetical protein VJB16_05670 [archaeon]|nr:hypothetical protein [archaeon]
MPTIVINISGIVETIRAKKVGPNCLFVPLESTDKILAIFKELGIQARTIYVQTL